MCNTRHGIALYVYETNQAIGQDNGVARTWGVKKCRKERHLAMNGPKNLDLLQKEKVCTLCRCDVDISGMGTKQ